MNYCLFYRIMNNASGILYLKLIKKITKENVCKDSDLRIRYCTEVCMPNNQFIKQLNLFRNIFLLVHA